MRRRPGTSVRALGGEPWLVITPAALVAVLTEGGGDLDGERLLAAGLRGVRVGPADLDLTDPGHRALLALVVHRLDPHRPRPAAPEALSAARRPRAGVEQMQSTTTRKTKPEASPAAARASTQARSTVSGDPSVGAAGRRTPTRPPAAPVEGGGPAPGDLDTRTGWRGPRSQSGGERLEGWGSP